MKIRYKQLRKNYFAKIKKRKEESWRNFIEREGNDKPFGFIYKQSRDKINIRNFVTNIRTSDGYTRSREETMTAILDVLFGESCGEEKQDEHTYEQGSSHHQMANTVFWTKEEVKRAIRMQRNNEAPGLDKVETEMIKMAAKTYLLDVFTSLYNACQRVGYYPRSWKEGNIKILLKGKYKDPTLAKSYRPVCLLPIMSKVFERLIKWKLGPQILHPSFTSERQYGYRTGKGTEDAIAEVRKIVAETEENMALALLFDVTGAFDNLKWSSVLKTLEMRECPGNLFRVVQDYLKERTVTVSDGNKKVTKIITKGCPQGSIVGPEFWNICLDELLVKLEKEGFQLVAYADNLIVIIKGDSRRGLEDRGQQATDLIDAWCKEQGLQLSKTKTEMVMLKDVKRKN